MKKQLWSNGGQTPPGHISDHVLVVMASLTSLKPKYFSDAYDLFEGGAPSVATKTLSSHLAAQNVSPPWSRCLVCCTPQPISTFRFSGEDLLLVVVSREFFGPFVRIPYLKKNRCQENRWKKTSAATTYQPFTDHQEDFWKVLGVQQIRNCLPQC